MAAILYRGGELNDMLSHAKISESKQNIQARN